LPQHPATLDEIRDKIISQIKQQTSEQLAKSKVEELAKRVKSGEKFAAAAKALGLDAKTSDPFARNGSVSGLGSGKLLSAAFSLKSGDVGNPLQTGSNWAVYQLVEKTEPNPDDFEKQKKTITDTLLQSKRQMAFEAFRTALEDRLKAEGKLKIMPDKLRGYGDFGGSGNPSSD
jgi:peptidyl-prolyl cis-trans isomerase D